MAQIRIDKKSEIPVHKQIVEQIIVLIATGRLEQGETLPTGRRLAAPPVRQGSEGWLIGQRGSATP